MAAKAKVPSGKALAATLTRKEERELVRRLDSVIERFELLLDDPDFPAAVARKRAAQAVVEDEAVK